MHVFLAIFTLFAAGTVSASVLPQNQCVLKGGFCNATMNLNCCPSVTIGCGMFQVVSIVSHSYVSVATDMQGDRCDFFFIFSDR